MDKNYTKISNTTFDFLATANLSGAEMSVLALIIRQTWCYHRATAEMSDGFIAKGTGLSVRTVKRVVASLTKKGLIKIPIQATGSHPRHVCMVKGVTKVSPVTRLTPRGVTSLVKGSDKSVTTSSDNSVTQETKRNNNIKNKKEKKKEIAFLNSLPERIRVLDPSDLSDDDFEEWSDRRDAWEAEHGEIYAEDDV